MKTLEIGTQVALKNILFATDFSDCSNAALPFALGIARRYGAKLYAAHILSTESYLFATSETWPAMIDCVEQRKQVDIARLEEHLRGVQHQVLTPVGDISDVIFHLVRDYEIDLLVLGTRGRNGLPKLFMGSVAEKIFRQASCPVLTVGPHVPRGREGDAGFQRIVFATDFSPESMAAAPYAISLAQEHGAHLTVVHVLQQPETGTVDLESNTRFLVRRLEELVPPDPELWFQPEYRVEFGKAPERILKSAATNSADLIVLGVRPSRGNPGAITHLATTTAQQIVAQAGCPVLTVRG